MKQLLAGSKGSAGRDLREKGGTWGESRPPAFCMKALQNHSYGRGAPVQDGGLPGREYGDGTLGDWGYWVWGLISGREWTYVEKKLKSQNKSPFELVTEQQNCIWRKSLSLRKQWQGFVNGTGLRENPLIYMTNFRSWQIILEISLDKRTV